MPREIRSPLTLRITSAEVIQSQLTPEDLRALLRDAGEDGTLCPGVYCEGGYSGPEELIEKGRPVERAG